MDDFIEYTVKKKTTNKQKLIRVLNWAFMVYLAFMSIIWLPVQFVAIGLFVVVGYWFLYHFIIYPMTDLEFDYIYCEKEITIDKVMARKKRKQFAVYSLEKMSVLAPLGSEKLKRYDLDGVKVVDLSSGAAIDEDNETGEKRYVMFYDTKTKVILDLSPEFVKIIQNNALGKVYLD
ncbi:MAG: hypothetical protein IKO53_01995 [Lachnospiraceae bacterium]|nr:hypothetical protein [Lachnospiraceae bacterium]MBR4542963.1 hypothetical protein [Lachnospiraceae bacterium]